MVGSYLRPGIVIVRPLTNSKGFGFPGLGWYGWGRVDWEVYRYDFIILLVFHARV